MRKLNKAFLLESAKEFGTKVTQTNTIREIRLVITEAKDYDVVAAKDSVATILANADQKKLEK